MRRLLTFLIIAALALRGLVPAGFMFAPSADGSTLSIVICSSDGDRAIALDDKGRPAQHKNGSKDHTSCPFAGTRELALSYDSAGQIKINAHYTEAHYFTRYASPNTRRWISSTLVHGPPSFQV